MHRLGSGLAAARRASEDIESRQRLEVEDEEQEEEKQLQAEEEGNGGGRGTGMRSRTTIEKMDFNDRALDSECVFAASALALARGEGEENVAGGGNGENKEEYSRWDSVGRARGGDCVAAACREMAGRDIWAWVLSTDARAREVIQGNRDGDGDGDKDGLLQNSKSLAVRGVRLARGDVWAVSGRRVL